jgi:hypothetical protein
MSKTTDNGCVELEARVPKDSKVVIALIGLFGAILGGAGVSAPSWITSSQSTASAQSVTAVVVELEEVKTRLQKIEQAVELQREQISGQNAKLDLLIQASPYIKVKSHTITVTR